MTPRASIPLAYFGHPVGHAAVDPELTALLPPGLLWTLDLPKADRQRHVGRPDVLLSRLLEEPEFLSRCHPMLQTSGLVIRLSHLALRRSAAEAVTDLFTPALKESAKARIRLATQTVGRIVFVNRSRVDCRLSNLREISIPELDESLPEDTHPSCWPPELNF